MSEHEQEIESEDQEMDDWYALTHKARKSWGEENPWDDTPDGFILLCSKIESAIVASKTLPQEGNLDIDEWKKNRFQEVKEKIEALCVDYTSIRDFVDRYASVLVERLESIENHAITNNAASEVLEGAIIDFIEEQYTQCLLLKGSIDEHEAKEKAP